ncbi:MAG TPA: histidine--tRNA ligase [Planctomycetota bacterium]|nr:histidine--tRNA ligase [Planctomycetota bacterium]
MRDVLPAEMPAWERLEGVGRDLARRFGYAEIRPSLLEETDLFVRSVGEVTDIVEKEMFTLSKGENSLTLRPEGTAGIVRAYLQAGFARAAPLQKLFTIGPMFRYERPQKGRERMFTQFDCEALGSLDPRLDAEIVHLAASFFAELGLAGLEVRLNSMGDGADRDRFRAAVRAFVEPTLPERCELCRARFERNVLRVLDCKHPRCVELNAGAPHLIDLLDEGNRAHFDEVCARLEDVGLAIAVDPGIVRGLDYYTRTVFEVHYPALGARSALCGGGRYDHLVRDLGGPDLGAVGFAVGFSGTLLVLEELGLSGDLRAHVAAVYVAAADEAARAEVFRTASRLRAAGHGAVFDSEGRSLKAQLKAASAAGHPLCVVLGGDEIARGVVQLRDMRAKSQRELAASELLEAVGARRAADGG